MRWVRYEANGGAAYGILDGDTVNEVKGDPFAGYERTQLKRPFGSVKLLVPVEPRTFYCAGLNYADHVIQAAKKRGEEPKLPPEADIGYRANNALIAHGENIVIPKDAGELVQYEAELVAVIGLAEPVQEPLDHVARQDELEVLTLFARQFLQAVAHGGDEVPRPALAHASASR